MKIRRLRFLRFIFRIISSNIEESLLKKIIKIKNNKKDLTKTKKGGKNA